MLLEPCRLTDIDVVEWMFRGSPVHFEGGDVTDELQALLGMAGPFTCHSAHTASSEIRAGSSCTPASILCAMAELMFAASGRIEAAHAYAHGTLEEFTMWTSCAGNPDAVWFDDFPTEFSSEFSVLARFLRACGHVPQLHPFATCERVFAYLQKHWQVMSIPDVMAELFSYYEKGKKSDASAGASSPRVTTLESQVKLTSRRSPTSPESASSESEESDSSESAKSKKKKRKKFVVKQVGGHPVVEYHDDENDQYVSLMLRDNVAVTIDGRGPFEATTTKGLSQQERNVMVKGPNALTCVSFPQWSATEKKELLGKYGTTYDKIRQVYVKEE